jgi:hypothetical protein
MDRRDTLRALVNRNLGRTIVFFDCTNVTSYAMARLKKCNYYRSKNRCVLRHQIEDEQRLRSRLSEDQYAAHIAPGGAWWKHVQSWTAEIEATRVGDAKRLGEVLNAKLLCG